MLKGFRSLVQLVDEPGAAKQPNRIPARRAAPLSAAPATPAASGGPRHAVILDADAEHATALAEMVRSSKLEAAVHTEPAALLRGLAARPPALTFVAVAEDGDAAIETLFALAETGNAGAVQLLGPASSPVTEVVRRVGARHGLKMLPPLTKPIRPQAVRHLLVREGFVATTPLGSALAAGLIDFWYQPKIDLQRRQIVGVETLARSRDPKGALAPSTFLADANTHDLAELTHAALIAALGAAAELARNRVCLRVAVNIPVSALGTLPIAEMVRDLGPSAPAWTGLLLDLNASELAGQFARVERMVEPLEAANVRLAVDDVSGGQQPLDDLRRLRLAELKLARSIVTGCANDGERLASCRSVVEAARELEVAAVAVGIEGANDMKALSAIGCDIGQGFVFGPPMPVIALVEMVNKRAVTPQEPAQRGGKVASGKPAIPRKVWA